MRWERLRSDRLLQARLLLGAALAAHAVAVLIMSRGWFFTGDDWDYLARSGWGDVLAPHGGHITTFIAAAAVAARGVAGLDFWPAYPLVISVVWPAVAYAAWWHWRRSGVEPLPAAAGAAVIAWLVTGAYVQFGHMAMASVLATLVAVVVLDERRLTPRTGAAGLALSLFAVLAGSTGVVVTAVRALTALAYRKWAGVATAVPALAAYGVVRLLVGSDRGLSFGFGVGDVGTIVRIVMDLIGPGMRWLLMVPTALEDAAAVLLIVASIGVVVWRRFDYRSVALVLSGAAYLGSVAVVRVLPRPDLVEEFARGIYREEVQALRYVNPPLIALAVLALPLLAAWAGRGATRRRWIGPAVVAVVLLVSGVARSVGVLDRISDKSIPRAREAAAVALLVDAGEPLIDPDRRAGPANSVDFTIALVEDLSRQGLVGGMLGSEIYGVRGIEVTAEDEARARGLLRFATARTGEPGSWADVGIVSGEECRDAGGGIGLTITRRVDVRLVWSGGEGEAAATASWEGEEGIGVTEIGPEPFGRSGRMILRIAGPPPGSAPAAVTITGDDIGVCLRP